MVGRTCTARAGNWLERATVLELTRKTHLMTQELHIFGVRHHGPGSARAVLRALDSVQPDCVLIEGPPDADEMIPWGAKEGMQPPVSILIYQVDDPKHAVFYPFAEFSPEWCTIRWAIAKSLPVRFMDLPQT